MFAAISSEAREWKAKLEAISKSQAEIEFKLDGTIITANENFLKTLGYELGEIKGKHHSMFVESAYGKSAEYAEFWKRLQRGEFQSAEYMRLAKGGREVWIQATYNPVFDLMGKPYKVVKFATDVTERKLEGANVRGQIAAIHKSQAVIEFRMDGTILTANPNFLGAVGYELSEIQGKHHSMFVEPDYKSSAEYKEFWASLQRGEYQTAEYKRIGKGDREIWIQASYNPIMDLRGNPFKVVKFATDVTEMVKARMRAEAVQKVIDENLDLIDAAIHETAGQSANAADASTQTAGNVQAIAAGVEEMNTSVREIATTMSMSRAAADVAVENTHHANLAAQRLDEATKSMGGIVGLINDITDQINLLALNATIEAARAGDAGRGFAVVASEVKNLSRQAREATDKIAQEVSDTRAVSDDVIRSLGAIRDSIETLRENVSGAAGAIEEQSTVANEMSSNMQAASGAVEGIAGNIASIVLAANQAEQSNDSVRNAVLSLRVPA
ncbi:MAG: methyl-accepting chemotaxis protein [Parvibaculaceae bacterium]